MVLVVEDEPSVRTLATKVLTRHGYRVVTAANGVEALQQWERSEREFDLVITDVVMPEGLRGPELVTRLRSKRPSVRVILTSGYSADLSGELVEGAAVSVLPKPFDPNQLLKAVRESLDGGHDRS